MIYIEMYGRLGNQFFRYAVARAIQKKYYPNEKIVISLNQINILGKLDNSFYDVLQDFNVIPYEVYSKKGKAMFRESSIIQKIICFFYYIGLRKIPIENMNEQITYQAKWENILSKMGIYWYRNGMHKIQKSNQDNKFISGNFEASSYFKDIRKELLQEFRPKHLPLEKNYKLYNKILKTNSICLSVRRGDFETNEKFKNLHSVCNKEYFMKAIMKIKELVENPVFFFFSDDIQWVTENIETGCETYHEDGDDPVWEKLRMMSMCKHFIISNSTFSWWAQYLADNEEKIVVSPSRWFNNDYKSPLIEDSFIKIEL